MVMAVSMDTRLAIRIASYIEEQKKSALPLQKGNSEGMKKLRSFAIAIAFLSRPI